MPDRKCPNCSKQITHTVDDLAVNYALISSQKKYSSSKSPSESELCRNHGCQVDYLCVDCGDLVCWKCSRDLHLRHRVESVEDLMANDSTAYARTELRQIIQGKLDALKKSLLIPREMMQLFNKLKKYGRELEDWLDFRQALETSVAADLETWDSLIANPVKENKKTLKDVMRRINEVNPPHIQTLSQIKEKVAELSKKAAELEKFFQESSANFNSEAAALSDDASELLPNSEPWTLTNEALTKSAFASILAGHKASKISVVSLPSEPIRRLPARLDALGSVCDGAIELKPLDSFWRASTGSDERLQLFIQKHGYKVSKFYGSPEDALLVCNASRQSNLSLGVRLCTIDDLDRCSALSVKPSSVCCIQSLPVAAGTRMLQLGWRPFQWHFPDLHDVDLDWMITLMEILFPPPVVESTWIVFASILGTQLFHCHLPRCCLTEKGFKKLLEHFPEYVISGHSSEDNSSRLEYRSNIIYCEPVSLSVDACVRLTFLAKRKEIDLRWEFLSETNV
ncbi:B-box-type zinc finger [Trinorchestia longiramus]|nr:B-box-type zinc finger [Trinorchestia longiramus]